MWIQVIGAAGSGKSVIVDYLLRNDYELIDVHRKDDNGDYFLRELYFAEKRLHEQISAQDLMDRKDVVTVRSFWDSHEVFVKVAHHFHHITDSGREILNTMYRPLVHAPILKPPHATIYVRMPNMSAYNRMLLKNVDVDSDIYNKQVEFYEEYVTKIRSPLIEIDGAQTQDIIIKQLEFDLASIKLTAHGGNIWQKEYLGGYSGK